MKSPGPSILIVDDEEDAATLLCELLRKRDYAAESVSSGAHCLEYLRSGVADVVITDIQMPGMSGIELCHELSLRHADLLSIVLTGVADLERAIGSILAGAFDFITKPVKLELVEIAIERAVEHLSMRREVTRLRNDTAVAAEGIVGSSLAIRKTIERSAAPREPMQRCSSPARAARARSSSRALSITARRVRRRHSSRSTAVRCRQT